MKCKRAQQRGWMRLVYGGDWRRQCGLDGVWAETVVASVSKSGLQMLARSVGANKKRETRPETSQSHAKTQVGQRHYAHAYAHVKYIQISHPGSQTRNIKKL